MEAHAARLVTNVADELASMANAELTDGDGIFTAVSEDRTRMEGLAAQLRRYVRDGFIDNNMGLEAAERTGLQNAAHSIMREAAASYLDEGSAENLLKVADDLRAMAADDLPETPAAAPAETGNELLDLVKDLLGMAKDADGTDDKMTLLKAVTELLGGEGGETPAAPQTVEPEPALQQTTLSGDSLRPWLEASGGSIGMEDGAFGVKDGANKPRHEEIDLGESLIFTVPGDMGEVSSAQVKITNLFDGGPDGRHTETGEWVAYNAAGEMVGRGEFQGNTPNRPGELMVDIETSQPFHTLHFIPTDNGAGARSSNNSDFTVESITLNHEAAAPTEEPSGPAPTDNPAPAEDPPGMAFLQELSGLLGQVLDLIAEHVTNDTLKDQLLDMIIGMLETVLASVAPGAEG